MLRKIVIQAFIAGLCVFGFDVEGQDPRTSVRPLSYGIVVDNSGSYRTVLERVIRFSHSIKDRNNEGDETFLVSFVDSRRIKVRQELTASKDDLGEAIDNMFVEGGATAVLDAVRFSLDYLSANIKERNGREAAILLISDGDDTASSAKLEAVVAFAKEANIRIVVVGLSDEKVNAKLLDRLAKGSGGTAFFPRTPKEMTEMVERVAAALRGR